MNLSLLAHVAPLIVAALLSAAMVVAALPQRSRPHARWFMAFSAGLVFWTVGYALELALPDLDAKVFAARLQYLGVATVPATWLLFAAAYAGVGLARWKVGAVFLVPLVTLALAWTNGAHDLIWTTTSLRPGPGFDLLGLQYGRWFWVHVTFSYLALLTSAGLLVRVILVRPPLFRRQAVLLLVGAVSPWLGNLLYLGGVSPNALDLTVFGFAVSGLTAGWAILRWQLLSVGPIARDTLVDGLAEGVVVIDGDGRIVDVNPAAGGILGRDPSELIGALAGDTLGAFLPPLDPSSPGSITVEDGGRSWECRVQPLRNARARVRGWILVLYDVTRRAEESAALERARRAAEDTARAQRAFMTNMNHELRTPLNGVLGMLQVLEQADLDPVNAHYVALARESGENLLDLVTRLLEFASLESGQMALNAAPMDVNAVVRAATEAHGASARAKGLAVQFTPDEDLPRELVGDAARLAQLVDGLVDNAVKFTDAGRVHVRVSGQDMNGGGGTVRVEVFDTGVGIPPDRLDHVFQDFVQADGSSTRRHEGAGVGLPLSRRLVERMGGSLHVESEPGKGSRFWFTVPMSTPPVGSD